MSEKLLPAGPNSAPKFVGAEKQGGRYTGRLCFSCSPTSPRQGEGATEHCWFIYAALFARPITAANGTRAPPALPTEDSISIETIVLAGWRGEVGLKARRIWGHDTASLRGFPRRAPLPSVGRGKRRGSIYRTCSIVPIVTCSIDCQFLVTPVSRLNSEASTRSAFRFPYMPENSYFATWYSGRVKGCPFLKGNAFRYLCMILIRI